jgi:hypothetical protein
VKIVVCPARSNVRTTMSAPRRVWVIWLAVLRRLDPHGAARRLGVCVAGTLASSPGPPPAGDNSRATPANAGRGLKAARTGAYPAGETAAPQRDYEAGIVTLKVRLSRRGVLHAIDRTPRR